MKAAAFDYVRATDAAHAQALLAEHGAGARLLAGGQSLLATLNLRLSDPAILIDIGRIGLNQIVLANGVLRIGALTTHADIARSPLVATHAPMLAEAAPLIAHAAIRNRGTLGGSLALADPAAEWPACVLALGATVLVSSTARGARRIAAEDFFQGLYQTAMAPDEMILGVEFPRLEPGEAQACMELARRHGDYALVGLAITRRGAGWRCAFFGVGPTPMLARAAMAAAEGLPPREAAAAAVAALPQDLDPPDDPSMDAATRLHLAQVLLRRAIERLGA